MADDNIIELGVDDKDSKQRIQGIAGTLNNLASKMVEFTGVTEAVNKKGIILRTTLRGVDDELNKLSVTFKNTRSGFVQISASSDNAVVALRRLKREALDAKAALTSVQQGAVANRNASVNSSAAQSLRPSLTDALKGGANAGIASKQELRNFNSPVEGILKQVSAGVLPAGQLDSLFARFKSGATDFTSKEREIVQLFKQATQAANEFGAASQNAANRAARAQSKSNQSGIIALAQAKAQAQQTATHQGNQQQLVGAAQAAVGGIFGNAVGNAAPKQIVAFNTALQQAYNLLQQNKVNLAQFIAAANNVKAGNIQGGLIGPLNQLQNAFVRAQAGLTNLGTAGTTAATKIGISWQGVIRLFETQILYSAFSKLSSAFQQSATDAAEYEKKIALVQTISQDAGLSFQEWSGGIRKVSDELGSPIVDVATAAYDSLSNQVTHAGETFGFVSKAIEFGKTTATSAADSINLFSSAINSFGLTANDSERVARTFFATIDLGRVTGSELANSFGRAGVLADTLGLSLEELGAGISTLTRQGIKYNEAYTLLNNVNLKLIKPTVALQGFFKKLGYETGQDAIAALGFLGVLQALDKEFQGDTAKVAKYFDEIRGARGALNLTGRGLQEFAADLDKIKNAGKDFDVAKDLVNQTAGQKFTEQLNQLKNFFTVDIGTGFLHSIVDITQALGGIKGIIQSVSDALKIAAASAAAFVLVNVAARLSAINFGAGLLLLSKNLTNVIALYRAGALASTLFNASVILFSNPFVIASLVGILAGVAIAFSKAADTSHAAFEQIKEASKEAADALIANSKEAEDKRHETFVDGLDKSKQAFLQYTAEVRKGYNDLTESLIENQHNFNSVVENSFDRLKSLIGKSVTSLDAKVKKSEDNITKAKEGLSDATDARNEGAFEDRLNRAKGQQNPQAAVQLIENRIQQLRAVAAQAFRQGDLSDAEKAYAKIDRLLSSIANQSQKIKVQGLVGTKQVSVNTPIVGSEGKSVKHNETQDKFSTTTVTQSLVSINTIEAQRNLILKERAILTQKFIADQEQIKINAESDATTQAKILAELEDEFKAIHKFTIFKKNGDVKDEFQGPEGRAKATSELEGHQTRAKDLLTQAGARVPDRIVSSESFGRQRADLEKQLDDQAGGLGKILDVKAKLQDLSKAEDAIKAGAEAAKTQMEGFRNAIQASEKSSINLKKNVQDLSTLLKNNLPAGNSIVNSLFSKSAATPGLKSDIETGLASAGQHAANASTPQAVKEAQTELDGIIIKIQELQNLEGVNIFNKIIAGANPNDPNSVPKTVISTITEIKQALGEMQRQSESASSLTQGLAGVEVRFSTLTQKARDLGIVIKGINDQQPIGQALTNGVSQAVGLYNSVARELNNVASALQRVSNLKNALPTNIPKASGKSSSVEENHFGGMVGHFSDGGSLSDFLAGKFAKGSDTIPAMLARGEYVVNSRQTRQFLPLLKAINSGRLGSAPSGTSTTIGDINVTVQGGPSGEATGKSIANTLRRELRRGTVKL